ncbi:hypothetical protein POM88_035097 [Heracleum sosnowskyi]|uniref:NB-ARC domain-containing protein n=1 Tax=Heracleum sosnowskyi TaxID=360622 RepID=A0AAD8HKJ2_9APIA|nr:hypothetical protein POM88_035097 [Heracleum sosnowskyi]
MTLRNECMNKVISRKKLKVISIVGMAGIGRVDDIWSNEAWDDFQSCFPDDNNGSKIMLTTRLKDVALHAQSDGNLLCLPFLTEEESFDLFKRKTFPTGNFFNELKVLIGKTILKKCNGLPLAIVVIAGFLKNYF